MNSQTSEGATPLSDEGPADAARLADVIPVRHRQHDLAQAPSMRRQSNASIDRSGVYLVGGLVERAMKWVFREQSVEDYGIDAQMEVVGDDTPVTGRLIGLQIKSGQSYFREIERSKSEPGWNFYADSAHLAYWLQHSLPVVVVINHPDTSEAYFQVVRQDLITETTKGFNLYIPETNRFDASAKVTILDFIAGWRDLESSLADAISLLPPNCASVLR